MVYYLWLGLLRTLSSDYQNLLSNKHHLLDLLLCSDIPWGYMVFVDPTRSKLVVATVLVPVPRLNASCPPSSFKDRPHLVLLHLEHLFIFWFVRSVSASMGGTGFRGKSESGKYSRKDEQIQHTALMSHYSSCSSLCWALVEIVVYIVKCGTEMVFPRIPPTSPFTYLRGQKSVRLTLIFTL